MDERTDRVHAVRFRCGLDVFEDEPAMKPGLKDLPNATIVPHIASAALWTRGAMATLAASNVAGLLRGWPMWSKPEVIIPPFIDSKLEDAPHACPSIVNAKELELDIMPPPPGGAGA